MGNEGIAPPLLTSALNGIGQFLASTVLPLGKQPPVPYYRRLGGPQSRCKHYGEGKIVCLYQESNSNSSIVQPSRYTKVTLNRMRYVNNESGESGGISSRGLF
jgi:hypothetical protein